ncbi:MAG: ACT domain-containing protein [Ilumatobacter sp.]|nr:ACT domain-containing protein [Ilumatobacter sp.]
MNAPGETDVDKMLADLSVERRPGVFTFVAVRVPTPGLLAAAHAMVEEGELTTLVVPIDAAERAGLPVTVEMAWLTLAVQSSLEAVGLTAVVAQRLTAIDVPCNVLAGYHHDHLLVPVDRADDAVAALVRDRAG